MLCSNGSVKCKELLASRPKHTLHQNRSCRSVKLQVSSALRARWCIDVRYGCKQEATLLLQEWVRDVGKLAGLSSDNSNIYSGYVGIPESRLELEVTFQNLSEWESFLSAIPFQEHKAWSQRAQSMIVHGSPVWQVYREIPVKATLSNPAAKLETPLARKTGATEKVVFEEEKVSVASIGVASNLEIVDDSAAAAVLLDWKGEPMTISPGDKLPFKFL